MAARRASVLPWTERAEESLPTCTSAYSGPSGGSVEATESGAIPQFHQWPIPVGCVLGQDRHLRASWEHGVHSEEATPALLTGGSSTML